MCLTGRKLQIDVIEAFRRLINPISFTFTIENYNINLLSKHFCLFLIHCQHFLYKAVCLWHLEYKLAVRIQRPQSWLCIVRNDRCCLGWPQLQKSRWSNLRAFQQKKFELKQACLLFSSFSCTMFLCCLPTLLPDWLPMLLILFLVLPTIFIFIVSKIFFPFHLCLSCSPFTEFLVVYCTYV